MWCFLVIITLLPAYSILLSFSQPLFSLPGPREQVNQVTSFIDASSIYGSSKEEADELRAFSGGLLKVQRGPSSTQILVDDSNQIDCKATGRFK